MASRKRQPKAKRMAARQAGSSGMVERAAQREAAAKRRSCTQKKRYASRMLAEDAIFACEEHGTTGLSCYQCSYCNGWHLTSRQGEF